MENKLPKACQACNITCPGNCEHYQEREKYFTDPRTLKRIYDIQQEDFTLEAFEC